MCVFIGSSHNRVNYINFNNINEWHGGKTADWIKIPLPLSMLNRFPLALCGCTRVQDRKLRAARIIVYFCPSRTSTGRKECGLGKGRYV